MALTQISTDGVKNDAISHNKIPANAIQASELADDAVDTAAIADGAVTYAKIENFGQNQVLGRVASGSGAATNLTAANVRTLINVEDGATADQTASEIKTLLQSDKLTNSEIADQTVTLDKLPHGTSSNDGKFLRANNGADPTFETISIPAGTTIGGNANNRIITGSDTANTLQADADVTYDAATSDFSILGSKPGTSMDLIVQNNGGGNAAGARITIQSGSAANTGPQFGMICGSKTWYLQTPKNVGALDFHGNGTRTFRLLEDGHVEIANGDLTLGTLGHGIDFYGGSGSYRQAANTLDDYEEGSWVPDLRFNNGNTGMSYSQQTGKYIKIGGIVIARFGIKLTARGSSTGSARILGLPYNGIHSSYYHDTGATTMVNGGTDSSGGHTHVFVTDSSKLAVRQGSFSNTNYDSTHTAFTDSTGLFGTVVYSTIA